MTNKHKNMDLVKLWFKKGEYNKLVSCVNGNFKDEAFDILAKMQLRGDLG